MTTKTNEPNCDDPLVAVFCCIIGFLSIVVGCLIFMVALFATPTAQGQGMAAGFMVMFGSILWFALARIIILLAQIAHNTKGALNS